MCPASRLDSAASTTSVVNSFGRSHPSPCRTAALGHQKHEGMGNRGGCRFSCSPVVGVPSSFSTSWIELLASRGAGSPIEKLRSSTFISTGLFLILLWATFLVYAQPAKSTKKRNSVGRCISIFSRFSSLDCQGLLLLVLLLVFA